MLQLTNGTIYTLDPRQPRVSSLLIKNGLIHRALSVPESDDIPIDSKIIDLNGKVVLPGLIDSHVHLRQIAESLQFVDCETSTKKECLERVAARVAETPPGEWIQGHGWNHNTWKGGFGTAQELDQVSPENPVYLTGKSLHVSWANTTALIAANISETTLDPPRGSLKRFDNGQLTGILLEDAVKLIEKVIPIPDVQTTAKDIQAAQEYLWKMGLTGVHDFDKERCLKAVQYLTGRDLLRIRILKSIPVKYLDQAAELGYRTGQGNEWLWFGGVKDFVDGALGPQTAAMLKPYEGTANERGMLLMTEEDLLNLGIKAARAGLALSIHAIGDLANRTLLNAFEKIRGYEGENNLAPLPHRIEHVQLIHPDDLPRLAELDITASMQPIHATSDMVMAEKYWGERTAYAYNPKGLLDHGIRVVFGSDAPVENPNPFWGIYAAVTRRNEKGEPGPEGWHPENRVTLKQALKGFTVNAADAAGKGDQQGKLSPGYWADLIVLDTDPFICTPEELCELHPVGTMVGGEWVWRDF